ncbi:type II toxin-antitoxin system YafQ family toxin [uncultured Bifidobacterium sp.]|uniref:type II toxin-antitoxin system RelE/ParE family toxin n=1 Tax=uncultured Bifidobacterium sp. TaxID=165187 RepID=UPI00258BF963|nr:type II toxin-antitoxin system YafQ family toxin [uncultured Bifidobacterium sp.]MEE0654424.1 type II toxin-antitoxin system YafQ family toxin [Bifidobacterium criceti]
MLKIDYTKAFERDIKRLKRRHTDLADLREVIRLVSEDTMESKETLRRRHRAHRLQGKNWIGVVECHVGNAGDWLTIWLTEDGVAIFLRTGTHAEIFGA